MAIAELLVKVRKILCKSGHMLCVNRRAVMYCGRPHCQCLSPLSLSVGVSRCTVCLCFLPCFVKKLFLRSLQTYIITVAQPGFRGKGTGGLGNGRPPAGPGAEPLVGGSGGIASRKLRAVIKDICLPNHAQFCVFSSTAQPEIFL